jgi:hypothetical protein
MVVMLAVGSVRAAPRVTLIADGLAIPGAGVGFRVLVQNDADVAARVPPLIVARVTSGNEVFFARTDATENTHLVVQWPAAYETDDRLIVPAHSTRSFELPAHLNEFFYDRRLSRAGVYNIELVLCDVQVPDEAAALRLYAGNLGHALVSNAAVVKVVKPTGSDAAVWSYMNRLAGSEVWGAIEWIRFRSQLKEYVFDHFPDTQYAALLVLRDPTAQSAEHFRSVGSEMKSSGRYGDWLRLAEAAYHESRARAELLKSSGRDLHRAAGESELAVGQYEQLTRTSASDLVKMMIGDSNESRVTPQFVRELAVQQQ